MTPSVGRPLDLEKTRRDPASQTDREGLTKGRRHRDSRVERDEHENESFDHPDVEGDGAQGGIGRERARRQQTLSRYALTVGLRGVKRLKCHLAKMNYLSSYQGDLYRRDIENFKYSSLRSSDSELLEEIRLPPIYINNRQGAVSVLVPDNTPIGTADVDGRRRSRRESVLHYQHGAIDDGDEDELVSSTTDEYDDILTVQQLGGSDVLHNGRPHDRRLTFAPGARRPSVTFPTFEFGNNELDYSSDGGHEGGGGYGHHGGHFDRQGSERFNSNRGFDGDGYRRYSRGSFSERGSFYGADLDRQVTPGGRHRVHPDQSNRSGGTRQRWSIIPGGGHATSGHGGDSGGHHQGHPSGRRGVKFVDGSYDEEMEEAAVDVDLPALGGQPDHPETAYGEYGAAAHLTRKPFQQMGFWEQLDVFKRAQRHAYATALATAQLRRPLPAESWMFGQRITRAFVFSYFGTSRKGGDGAGDNDADKTAKASKGKKKKKKKKKGKKMSEMKSIFGDVMPHDFYPGGKRNPDGYAF